MRQNQPANDAGPSHRTSPMLATYEQALRLVLQGERNIDSVLEYFDPAEHARVVGALDELVASGRVSKRRRFVSGRDMMAIVDAYAPTVGWLRGR